MTVIAAVILGITLPLVLFDLAARPTIRRLALRNVVRRPGEAALVVGGALLATALITASFIIGDSFGASIRNIAVDRWGPVDEFVAVDDPAAIDPAVAALSEAPDDVIDGVLGTVVAEVAVGSVGADRSVEPEVTLIEVDPTAAVAFTGDDEVVGGAPGSFGATDAVINERLAAELGVDPAADEPQSVDVFVGGEPVRFDVVAVRPATGLNGLGEVIVASGALSSLVDDPAAATSAVLVSNAGDVFGGADLTPTAVAEIERRLDGTASVGFFEVEPVKRDLLRDAEDEAAEMTELFGTIGGFSVAAGILLVVNLFVMLAGERKSELGTLRATGLRRGHLVRAFSLEGAVYGLAAAAIGVAVGIGVAAVVMAMAGDLLETQLVISLDVVPTSLLSGAMIGLAVSQLTVLLTSWRITRLNIVRALRDLPEPAGAAGGRRGLILGAAGLIVGIGGYVLAGDTPIVAMVAPVLALVSAVPLVGRIVGNRLALVVACSLALAWSAAVFGLLPDVMADPDVALFLVQGILLVGLATVIIAMGDRLWLAAARALTGGGIASRVGLAEPLARPVRTALLVAMYSLVIFTVTFMAVMNAVFQAQAPTFAQQAGGGYDLYVDANATSGLTTADLAARDGVAVAAPVVRGSSEDERVSGIDGSFLEAAPPALFARSDEFASDRDAWAAVAAGESYFIVDEDWGLVPGDRERLYADDGSVVELTVAGTTEQGWMVRAGRVMGADQARLLLGPDVVPTRHYVALAPGADAAALADAWTAAGAEQGVDAQTFFAAAKAETDAQQGFLNLLQGYLGLGLLIGIAGLGVVLVRAVRERRRQFGVMRALGIAAPVVRQAFIVEAAFVAVQGVALGIGLGMLSSWQVLTRSSAFEAGLDFTVPVTALVVLGLGCLLASLVMAAVPAIRAGRTQPAVALRMTT